MQAESDKLFAKYKTFGIKSVMNEIEKLAKEQDFTIKPSFSIVGILKTLKNKPEFLEIYMEMSKLDAEILKTKRNNINL